MGPNHTPPFIAPRAGISQLPFDQIIECLRRRGRRECLGQRTTRGKNLSQPSRSTSHIFVWRVFPVLAASRNDAWLAKNSDDMVRMSGAFGRCGNPYFHQFGRQILPRKNCADGQQCGDHQARNGWAGIHPAPVQAVAGRPSTCERMGGGEPRFEAFFPVNCEN